MKIYDKKDIDNKFEEAMNVINNEEIDALMLGVIVGDLSLSLESRIQQLKTGIGKSTSKDTELTNLQNALNCFVAKINNSSKDILKNEIVAAYNAYATKH